MKGIREKASLEDATADIAGGEHSGFVPNGNLGQGLNQIQVGRAVRLRHPR